MKRYNYLFILIMFLLFISSVSAFNYHKQNTDFNFSISSNFATTCTLTTINSPSNGTIIINKNASLVGTGTFYFNIIGTNYSQLGDYSHNIICYDSANKVSNSEDITVTPTGEEFSTRIIFVKLIIIVFFILLMLVFAYIKSNYDQNKSEKKLFKQYEDKNWIKLALGLVGFQFIRNSFVVYYLLAFPIILILNELIIGFGIVSLNSLFSAILLIYSIGVIIVGLIFFGYVQEWIKDAYDKINDMDWGVDRR